MESNEAPNGSNGTLMESNGIPMEFHRNPKESNGIQRNPVIFSKSFKERLMIHQGEGAKGIVKERMQLMKSYAASMKAINVELRDMASVNYILINAEANKIAESSQAIMGLFPPGSGGGVSEASPKIWQNPDDFMKIIEDLKKAARKLAQSTGTGVPKLVIENFRALGGTCKNCHQKYRVKKKG